MNEELQKKTSSQDEKEIDLLELVLKVWAPMN